jgi:transposase
VYNFPVCENPRHSCVHKSKAVRNAIRAAGARRLFLPAYSPDLNPIEQVFAKLNT